MRLVIDIPDGCYEELNNGQFPVQDAYRLVAWIKNGTPLPGGAEILTKEAYSDLCRRAADVPNFESEEYVNERLNNYNKLLKSGILDCVTDKTELCNDVPDTNVRDLISRQAVIQIIENKLNPCTDMFKCLEMSEIKEDVERLPSVEPEKCGDCISRKEVKQIEKAIEKLTYARQNADDELDPEWCAALDMAIKALEAEDVLDKIRKEIEDIRTYDEYTGESYLACEYKEDVLYIIDKYRAESEYKEIKNEN